MKINKTLLIALMACVIGGGIAFGVVSKIYKNKIAKIEDSYHIQIAQIEEQKDIFKFHSDSVDAVLAQYEIEIDSLHKIDISHRWEIDYLKDELTNAWNEIFDATVNENYNFLQNRYLTEDSLLYPFSGEQVKGIALDIVKLDYRDSVIVNSEEMIRSLRVTLLKTNNMVDVLYQERNEMELLTEELYDQLAAKTEELQVTDEEFEAIRKKLRIRTAGGIGTIVGLAALLILL